MKKFLKQALITVTILTILIGTLSACSVAQKQEVELTISAAASLTNVMKEITVEYKKEASNITLTFSFGSSGTLATQIEQGASADVFVSAAEKQMATLNTKNLLLKDTKINLLQNKVVLIVPKDSTLNLSSFNDVATSAVKLAALGEPASVPAGQYAAQIFTKLGILDAVKAKTNYATDVRQVLTWVENGEVDCGVVYASDAMTSDKVKVAAEAPDGSSDKIIYPAAVIASSTHPNEAKAFLKFLSSAKAAKIFEKYGFSMAE